jgi:hypothetical protein
MNKRFTFVIAGLFFVLMTISHLLCSFFGVKIVISGYTIPLVPLEASIVAIIITITLTIWISISKEG